MSVAVAEYTTDAPEFAVASTVMFAGIDRTGGVVSRTVMVNDPDEEFPAVSCDEQLTVLIPSGNVELDAGAQVTVVAPIAASSAVAVNETAAPPGPVASTVMLEGSVKTGGTVS